MAKKGLWYYMNKRRKEGKPKRKPGEKGYPGPGAFDRANNEDGTEAAVNATAAAAGARPWMHRSDGYVLGRLQMTWYPFPGTMDCKQLDILN